MKYLGVASHVGKSGLLTVKASYPPRIGTAALVKGRGAIGSIIDVFGPVSAPYVSVRLWHKFPDKQIMDVEIFVEEREERRFRKGRRYHAKRPY